MTVKVRSRIFEFNLTLNRIFIRYILNILTVLGQKVKNSQNDQFYRLLAPNNFSKEFVFVEFQLHCGSLYIDAPTIKCTAFYFSFSNRGIIFFEACELNLYLQSAVAKRNKRLLELFNCFEFVTMQISFNLTHYRLGFSFRFVTARS